MTRLYDISRTLAPTTAVWPGDTPIRFEHSALRERGDAVDCGAMHLTLHAGTHLDAPAHVLADTRTVDATPLEACLGEAVVLHAGDATVLDASRVSALLPDPPPATGERVLFRTTASLRPDEQWHETFPTLTPEAARWLVGRGVTLVGVDAPSVDAFDAPRLAVHEILLDAGVVILENLQLRDVPPGRYELIALPLKLAGLDGSPLRAVLRER